MNCAARTRTDSRHLDARTSPRRMRHHQVEGDCVGSDYRVTEQAPGFTHVSAVSGRVLRVQGCCRKEDSSILFHAAVSFCIILTRITVDSKRFVSRRPRNNASAMI
jgi:hypothetical protein